MTAEVTNLIWHGTETVDAGTAALVRCSDVQLRLPANFSHAGVARCRSPDVPPAAEMIDVSGGAELLARSGGIKELERVAAPAEPAQQAHAEVRVASPAPIVAIRCRDSALAQVE